MARESFIRYFLKCPLRTLRFRLLMSFLVGYVAGGFVQATVFSRAYAPGHFHDRITNGIAGSFMGTVFFGHACCEFGNSVNYWPYIALNTVVVFCGWMGWWGIFGMGRLAEMIEVAKVPYAPA